MRIYSYVLILLWGLCAGGIQAQSLMLLEKAVGGLSLRSVHQRALVQAELSSTVVRRGLVSDFSTQLPPETRLKGSLAGVLNGYARLPGNATQFSLPQLPDIELTAVEIYHATFVRNEGVFLPKGTYAIKMPDGDYRFFTSDSPASAELIAQINRARFGEMLEFDMEEQPKRLVWNGPESYTNQDELARDVARQRQPMAHYGRYAFMGPIDVYEVPAGVVYMPEGNNAPILLDPSGPYVLVVFKKTGKGQLVERQALQWMARP